MNVEALTLTNEDKQKENMVGTARDEESRVSVAAPVPAPVPAPVVAPVPAQVLAVDPPAKGKEAKPAAERKRTRNLS